VKFMKFMVWRVRCDFPQSGLWGGGNARRRIGGTSAPAANGPNVRTGHGLFAARGPVEEISADQAVCDEVKERHVHGQERLV